MITDKQARKLFKLRSLGMTITECADKTNMSRKTASKYLNAKQLPSQLKKSHNWRTRKDPFEDIWLEVTSFLEDGQNYEAKFLFEFFQREYPGKFQDGQLRTFQRRIKEWKAINGSNKEVFFAQLHKPGELSESDFTDMNNVGIRIAGIPFNHKLFHFVLTYSNWENGSICFSESFESLAYGLKKAIEELGAAPLRHRTDNLSAATNNLSDTEKYTKNYKELLDHYKIIPEKTNPASPNENGDIEQSHHRLIKHIRQALLLRGSNNFESRKDYELFLKDIFKQRNAGRVDKLKEEYKHMRKLPKYSFNAWREYLVRVTKFSTINVKHKTYSVNSRLIGEHLKILLYPEYLNIKYGHKIIDTIPRLYGKKQAFIQYRHIIDSLVRKPGAFKNYKYREELFPTTNFRITYDILTASNEKKGTKIYLQILQLAAKEGEALVESILVDLIKSNSKIELSYIKHKVEEGQIISIDYNNGIGEIDLKVFDELLMGGIF